MKYDTYRNNPVLRKGFKPPSHIPIHEAYSLYHHMVTGQPTQQKYLDQRHQIIHKAIEWMYEIGWATNMSTMSLISYLFEENLLEAAGGEAYINKIFGDLVCDQDTELA